MKRKRLIVLLASLLTTVRIASAQYLVDPAEVERRIKAGEDPPELALVDGLHITGQVIKVDIETYRLSVSGAVEHPLSLSMAEIESMEPVRISMDLECPGFFIDRGAWTGVPLTKVLELAGAPPTVRIVKFTSIDRVYSTSLPIDMIRSGLVLLAYKFNDKPIAPYHGFPLRVAARGLPGHIWVKWLGSIEVLE